MAEDFANAVAGATTAADRVRAVSNAGAADLCLQENGSIEASIHRNDLPPSSDIPAPFFPGTKPIPFIGFTGESLTITVADGIDALIKDGAFQNLAYSQVAVTNGLAQTVHRSYEYIGLSWALLQSGLPMGYLPEVWDPLGSASSFPTLAEILQNGEEYLMMHFAGHLHSYEVQKYGFLFTDTNKRGDDYIVEPCPRSALTMQGRIAKAFGLDASAFAIANRLKVIWDVKPFVLFNKGGASELGENLDRYPDVLYWLQRVHWLVMALLFPFAVKGAAKTTSGLKRMLTIGVGTHNFFHTSIFITEAGDLGLDIGLFIQMFCISHPMRWWLGVTFEEFRLVLQGFSIAFGNTNLTTRIAALTQDEIDGAFGNHFAFLIGTTIVVKLPGYKFLVSSASGLGRVIGCATATITAHLRGEKQRGTTKTQAEMDAGVTGSNFEGVQFEEYEGGRLAITPAGGSGAASAGTQEAPEFVSEHEASEMLTKAGLTRKPHTPYGTGSHMVGRHDNNGGGSAPTGVVFVDPKKKKLLAIFSSRSDASRASYIGSGFNESHARDIIIRQSGDVNKSSKSRYEDLVMVKCSELEEKYGSKLAAKYRKQMVQDKENLGSLVHLKDYLRGSEESKKRKSKRKGSINSFLVPKNPPQGQDDGAVAVGNDEDDRKRPALATLPAKKTKAPRVSESPTKPGGGDEREIEREARDATAESMRLTCTEEELAVMNGMTTDEIEREAQKESAESIRLTEAELAEMNGMTIEEIERELQGE